MDRNLFYLFLTKYVFSLSNNCIRQVSLYDKEVTAQSDCSHSWKAASDLTTIDNNVIFQLDGSFA